MDDLFSFRALCALVEAWLGKSFLLINVCNEGHRLLLAPDFECNTAERQYIVNLAAFTGTDDARFCILTT